jgi:acyl-homoserine lactone acylase PvdQ
MIFFSMHLFIWFVVFNCSGMIHIIASNELDVAFAQGVVCAQV